jgi:hypothetical protein
MVSASERDQAEDTGALPGNRHRPASCPNDGSRSREALFVERWSIATGSAAAADDRRPANPSGGRSTCEMVAGRGQGALASAALLTIATPQCRPKDATAICHPGPSGGESAPPRAARPQTKFRPLAPSVPRPWNLGGSPAAPDLMHWKLSWRRCHTVSTTLPSGSPTGHTHPSASAEALGRLRGRQHTEASNPCANHSRAANLRSDVRWPIGLCDRARFPR